MAVEAAGPAATVGWLWAGVKIDRSGVGKTVGGAVGVARRIIWVGSGVGLPARESEQAFRLRMTAILAAKRIRVRFISLSFLVGAMPPNSFYHHVPVPG
jgi:hypothetical protein